MGVPAWRPSVTDGQSREQRGSGERERSWGREGPVMKMKKKKRRRRKKRR